MIRTYLILLLCCTLLLQCFWTTSDTSIREMGKTPLSLSHYLFSSGRRQQTDSGTPPPPRWAGFQYLLRGAVVTYNISKLLSHRGRRCIPSVQVKSFLSSRTALASIFLDSGVTITTGTNNLLATTLNSQPHRQYRLWTSVRYHVPRAPSSLCTIGWEDVRFHCGSH